MYTCPKCGREIPNKGGFIKHLKFCKGKRFCANPNCDVELKPIQKIYCSSRCAALVNSPGRNHLITTRQKISLSLGGDGKLGPLRKTICPACGKPVGHPKKFCNHTCQQKYYHDQKVEKWLKGELDGSSKSGHASYVKRYLLEKYNNKCSKCGWGEVNPYTKNIPLEVEHIDGHSNNSRPFNVTLLCPNCHSLTKTYKGANRGNGKRSYMKKYYIRDEKDKVISGN